MGVLITCSTCGGHYASTYEEHTGSRLHRDTVWNIVRGARPTQEPRPRLVPGATVRMVANDGLVLGTFQYLHVEDDGGITVVLRDPQSGSLSGWSWPSITLLEAVRSPEEVPHG